MRSEQDWLVDARALMLRGDVATAESLLAAALGEYPRSFELRRILAAVCLQFQRKSQAESVLSELLDERPHDAASAFTLASLLISQCRGHAAAVVMRACFLIGGAQDPELQIKAIELLDGCERKIDASAIAEHAIKTTPHDPRLHAYAGVLASQLGEFECARQHYLYAIQHDTRACEWHIPFGLANAQRYHDAQHPDFALFDECLLRNDLSDKARSKLLFALGKAHDDIGGYEQAAQFFRQANSIAHKLTTWSRKNWRRGVQVRLAAKPHSWQIDAARDFVPVFIVGMPRSGTTLLAELLARHPLVSNCGESPWIAELAQEPSLSGNPDPADLEQAAATYRAHIVQDDVSDARWFIDKQPLNFRYVDLILILFPNAKIIHCLRNERDTALSLWMQSFLEDVQGYAYDFADIAVVMRDCDRLMARSRKLHYASICNVRYEELVREPQQTIAQVSAWIGLPEFDVSGTAAEKAAIVTSSLWQARQPIYNRSVGRWRNYSEHLPELLHFPIE